MNFRFINQILNFISSIINYYPFHSIFRICLIFKTLKHNRYKRTSIECWSTNTNKWIHFYFWFLFSFSHIKLCILPFYIILFTINNYTGVFNKFCNLFIFSNIGIVSSAKSQLYPSPYIAYSSMSSFSPDNEPKLNPDIDFNISIILLKSR